MLEREAIAELMKIASVKKIAEHKDNKLRRKIEDMLEAWAYWSLNDENFLGYRSNLALIMMPRVPAIMPRVVPIPSDANEMEQMIGRLDRATGEQQLALALKLQYLRPGIPQEVHAKKMGIHVRTFQHLVSSAKDWLCGYWEGLQGDRKYVKL